MWEVDILKYTAKNSGSYIKESFSKHKHLSILLLKILVYTKVLVNYGF